MQTVLEILRLAKEDFAFLAAFLVFLTVGQILKRKLYTKARASKNKAIRWLRATMALHPAIAGFVLGLIPDIPRGDWISGSLGPSFYYMLAGMASTVIYDTFKGIVKWRIRIPGLTDPPGPPPLPPSDEQPTNPGSKFPDGGSPM